MRVLLLFVALIFSGCVSERFFEARYVGDVDLQQGGLARTAFENGQNVALLLTGDGWGGKTVGVRVMRVGQKMGEPPAFLTKVPVPNGQYRWVVFKPTIAGNYVALAWDDAKTPRETMRSWNFTVLP